MNEERLHGELTRIAGALEGILARLTPAEERDPQRRRERLRALGEQRRRPGVAVRLAPRLAVEGGDRLLGRLRRAAAVHESGRRQSLRRRGRPKPGGGGEEGLHHRGGALRGHPQPHRQAGGERRGDLRLQDRPPPGHGCATARTAVSAGARPAVQATTDTGTGTAAGADAGAQRRRAGLRILALGLRTA